MTHAPHPEGKDPRTGNPRTACGLCVIPGDPDPPVMTNLSSGTDRVMTPERVVSMVIASILFVGCAGFPYLIVSYVSVGDCIELCGSNSRVHEYNILECECK
jgi:hypothetical protein